MKIINRAVLFSLLLALISYGLHYHISKALIHLAAFASIINLLISLKNRNIESLSTDKYTVLMSLALLLSGGIVATYTLIYNNSISVRHFENFSYPALYFSLILPSLKITAKDRKLITLAAIASGIGMGAFGTIDYLSAGYPGYRTSGALNMQIIYATCMAILTGWITAELFKQLSNHKWWLVALCLFSLIFGYSAIIFSGSRGPILTSFLVLISLFILYLFKIPSKRMKGLILVSTIVSSFVIGLIFSQTQTASAIHSRFETGIQQISTAFDGNMRQPSSVGIRLDMWESAITAIIDHPLIGIGPGKHPEYFSSLAKDNRIDVNTNRIISFDHIHNDYLQAWLSMGLLFGTMALLFILFPTLVFAKNLRFSASSISGLAICISFVLCGFTDTPSLRAPSLTLFLLVICLHIALLNHGKANKKNV